MAPYQQTTASSDGTSGEAGATVLKARAYQQEMLDESLRQNIIVAMETGSGKTRIAVLRIREELGRCPPDKLVWFIAPTVALAEQQYTVISQQLPAFQARMLSGADNVDHWSTQEIWDSILWNIRIVVSTPQVLLDAMSRGFVKLTRIALLVFDEAHSCMNSHPTNRIMQNFYHSLRRSGNISELPSVLGLTASPVTKASAGGLRTLEENLNAICRTPTIHREELLQHVHRPDISRIIYESDECPHSLLLLWLEILVDKALDDIESDPLIKRLRMRDDLKSQQELTKALEKGKTPCRQELKSLLRHAREIHEELGSWAADVFIDTSVRRFHASASDASKSDMLVDWETDEKRYVAEVLSKLPIPETKLWGSVPDRLSQKANSLIKLLTETYTPDSRVIIFAKQRVTVVMLSHLLSVHPLTKEIIPGHFLGNSSYAGRKSNLFELSRHRDQKGAVDDLRAGKKNLLVATSVLEEGIDVPACNLVICYESPKDLRSFIQRKGRARKQKSKLIVFQKKDFESEARWSEMEEVMKAIYSDNTRLLAEIEKQESAKEEGEEVFRIESTGARLSYDNARQYLDHFCATIACAYTETQPDFIVMKDHNLGLQWAKVILPSVLDPSLREISGKRKWRTEKMAKTDAAFQAYVALYKAGLVNDNLMPMHCKEKSNTTEPIEKRPGIVQASARFNPWIEIAKMWRENQPLFQTKIKFSPDTFGVPCMVILMPIALPCKLCFKIFWNQETTVAVSLKPNQNAPTSITSIETAADSSYLLLSSVFSRRMPTDRSDFPALFLPKLPSTSNSLKAWLASVKGKDMAQELAEINNPDTFPRLGLVRTIEGKTRPFTLESTKWMVPLDEKKAAEEEEANIDDEGQDQQELHLQGTTLPKRTDFLHPVASDAKGSLQHTAKQCIVASSCSIDRLPAMYSKFVLFIPSVIHKIEILLVADKLSRTILAPVGFDKLSLVMTAISAPVAREETNYQRLEFLGDSILKSFASLQLLSMNPQWHEGLLSSSKDHIVSNARLCKAALKVGLDAYILTDAFTGLKWRPSYISDIIESESNSSSRELSTKVIADVVEALIGASYIDGGMDKTLKCLKVFLPEVEWKTMAEEIDRLYDAVPDPDDRTPLAVLPEIEAMLGYTFTKKVLLVEGITHPSTQDKTVSYQRLEFLGDSILDHIVVQELFFHGRSGLAAAAVGIHHQDMHLMRTALVNKDFLAFLCMDGMSLEKTREDPAELGQAHRSGTTKKTTRVHLWQYMRHSASWDIVNAQHATCARYKELRDQIRHALQHSRKYPWALLSRLEAEKFFSDLIESLLGAIFIDSRGSMDACHGFLERIGLIAYIRRVLNEKILLLHPKQHLGLVAQSKRVLYDTKPQKKVTAATAVNGTESGSADADDRVITRRWVCSVRVGDEEIVEVDDGVSASEAETRAADAALEILLKRENNTALKEQFA